MVGLLTEFKPVESLQLISLEPRPATGCERRRKLCSSAEVLQSSACNLISSGCADTEIPKLLPPLLLIYRE